MPAADNDIKNWQNTIHCGDNLPLLRRMPKESVPLIYIDPPFNTGKRQTRQRITVVPANGDGDRYGFGGREYKSEVVGEAGYADSFKDYLEFLRPRLEEAHRILTPNGSLFFHIDWREAANCRLLLEEIFSERDCNRKGHCINEIIWAYDYGARAKNKWPTKHDNIYWFAKDPKNYIFNYDATDRIPYMAPKLVGEKKAARGKTPTDVWNGSDNIVNIWWQTIVPTNGKEKSGYPTQKPLLIAERIIKTHSRLDDVVMDFFAGSGTVGVAAKTMRRNYILMDKSKEAVNQIRKRLDSCCDDKRDNRKKNESTVIEKFNTIVLDSSRRREVSRNISKWHGSMYEWILSLPPATKGKIGRDLVARLCQEHLEMSVRKNKTFLIVNKKKISVKFSMLWESGIYNFEQLKEDCDYFFLLGISPSDVHAWVIPSKLHDEFDIQHSSKSKWLPIKPNDRTTWPDYLKKAGGQLDELSIKLFQQ